MIEADRLISAGTTLPEDVADRAIRPKLLGEEFRTAINDKGELGVWDTLLPCYTVFHEENETFSNLWTEWNDDLIVFLSNYERDIEMFGGNYGIDAKPDTPANTFPISSLP